MKLRHIIRRAKVAQTKERHRTERWEIQMLLERGLTRRDAYAWYRLGKRGRVAPPGVIFVHSSWLPDMLHAPQAEGPPQRLYQGELLQVDDGLRFVDSTTQPA